MAVSGWFADAGGKVNTFRWWNGEAWTRWLSVAADGWALLLTAEVHVSRPGLSMKYDRVVLALVRLRSGQHVAWYGLRANDSPKDVVRALEGSADTVTAR